MPEYIINVSQVEDMQMIGNVVELNQIFTRAQSTVAQGGAVVLTRQHADGSAYRFDKITTEGDLNTYKETVFKYL